MPPCTSAGRGAGPIVTRLLTLALAFAVVATGAAVLPTMAAAQVLSTPRFTVATANRRIFDSDVTVGDDGSVSFVWIEMLDSSDYKSGKAWARRFSPAGTALGPQTRIDTTDWANMDVTPSIVPNGTGGYVATWNILVPAPIETHYRMELYGGVLDANGALVGSDFDVSEDGASVDFLLAGSDVVAYDSGFVAAWFEGGSLWLRDFTAVGAARGSPRHVVDVPSTPGHSLIDLALTPDGRLLLVWQKGLSTAGTALLLDTAGNALGPPFPLAPAGSTILKTAISPTGVVGEISTTGLALVVRRYDASGTVLGEDTVGTGGGVQNADLTFDANGNLLAVWPAQVSGGVTRGRARAYDADGAPLGPVFTVDSTNSFAYPTTAAVAGGRFVIGWLGGDVFPPELQANVYDFCTPGMAVCGDGVRVSACEQCDDGAGNDDTLPSACRTDCRRARCGDGVIDAGEQCEDGNTVSGDCCSHWCRHERDFDQDGLCDTSDNCPLFPNPAQLEPEICSPASLPKLPEAVAESFAEGLEDFAEIEMPATGLGPVFNGASCAECHHRPTIGGSSTRTVTRFGRHDGGGFDPMVELGGVVLQANGITTPSCTVAGEVVPATSDVITTRDSPPLFGLGLVDTIPDDRLLQLADPNDANGDGISGRANVIGERVGRFGWKAQVVSLHDFVGEAYQTEMGITSPGFPTESNPQGAPLGCDPVADPEDDGTAVTSLTSFVTLLAPLPPLKPSPSARAGKSLFKRLQCRSCHTDKLKAGVSTVKALHRKKVPAFSDFLLHDMGPALGDGIPQGDASGSEFRTAPLWGVRASAPYLHDGRAATIAEAIAAHGGEAQAARDGFVALTAAEQAALVAYLSTF